LINLTSHSSTTFFHDEKSFGSYGRCSRCFALRFQVQMKIQVHASEPKLYTGQLGPSRLEDRCRKSMKPRAIAESLDAMEAITVDL